MPPGSRYPLRPVKPKQTSVTAAVAHGGSAALQQRAQAASYGATGQRQALQDTYDQIASTGTGFSSHPQPGGQYEQWQQEQGFRPQNYDVGFGQSDEGKYAGFKTEGELKSAIKGRGELAREEDMRQADQLKALQQTRLDDLTGEFDSRRASPVGMDIAAIAGLGGGRQADASRVHLGDILPGSLGPVRADTSSEDDAMSHLAQVQGQTAPYLNKLEDWYATQGQPLVEGMEFANDISRTPDREYDLRSGAEYGVDPNILAGWFPRSGEISDVSNQRDLESIHQTGLPYSEQQSTLGQLTRDVSAASQQQVADQQVQMDDDIYGITSHGGKELADAVGAPLDAVHQIVTDPVYSDATANVEAALAEAEQANPRGVPNSDEDDLAVNAIRQAVDAVIAQAQAEVEGTDPIAAEVLARILHSQYDLQ